MRHRTSYQTSTKSVGLVRPKAIALRSFGTDLELRTPAREGWAVVVDFDATITTQDISDAILLHYTSNSFKDVRESYVPGTVTEDWVREKFRAVQARPGELRKFVYKTGRLRPGFKRLLRICRINKIPVEIVSGGLDFYIRLLLNRWGIRGLKVYCANARWISHGLDVRYRYLNGFTLDHFKARRVLEYKKRGYRVVYMGDGSSDFEAAKKADITYARGTLLGLCRKNLVTAKFFNDFKMVATFLNSHH
ncbi:MAG: HAD-IB family phosphatase [Elusimicrobia bacterium]|nr:HAD-IB family phosphatase [Elusimicrobiota bacterium]